MMTYEQAVTRANAALNEANRLNRLPEPDYEYVRLYKDLARAYVAIAEREARF